MDVVELAKAPDKGIFLTTRVTKELAERIGTSGFSISRFLRLAAVYALLHEEEFRKFATEVTIQIQTRRKERMMLTKSQKKSVDRGKLLTPEELAD